MRVKCKVRRALPWNLTGWFVADPTSQQTSFARLLILLVPDLQEELPDASGLNNFTE